ncbi:carbon-nitrogen hydrolase family protein [Flaviaesturariibacter flavus]|uniref:Carbon-nitrogen hydrolase family protein n=1 Tax=Flaviaesturariibacter flavus TaxID=2502780 RepID=A0A4R1BBA5_9BACT|nr:carbon-nitrogen hydrolase family protein [Flaviaesturariibacter flavus]TCJ14244.1 carbon-nitrogen hydrolase family protein [Flaviaesturariibacter flavus]
MILCAAQIRPLAGDRAHNLVLHERFVRAAAAEGAALVLFPELSLTGYEPRLAAELAFTGNEPELHSLQQLGDAHHIVIGAGLPERAASGTRIGLHFFIPNKPRQRYAKQLLHDDELPFFIAGTEALLVELDGLRLAPAICYESLQPAHAATAAAHGARVYLASVAKSENGLAKAQAHYPAVAQQHNMHVLMANAVGPADDFICAGSSAAWTPQGEPAGALDAHSEGILIYDTGSGDARSLLLT